MQCNPAVLEIHRQNAVTDGEQQQGTNKQKLHGP
jgi:hypothetical protein